MKKVFLTFGMLIFSISIFAQEKVNNDDFIGWWITEPSTRCQLFFWKNVDNELKFQEISYEKGEGFIIRDYKVDSTTVYIKSSPPKFPYNVTHNYYSLLNSTTIYCESIDARTEKTTTVYFRKVRH